MTQHLNRIKKFESSRSESIDDQAFALRKIWLPPPSPKLDWRHTGRQRKQERGRVTEGTKTYDGEKAWSSVILSALEFSMQRRESWTNHDCQ
jgi:hypothetical protein